MAKSSKSRFRTWGAVFGGLTTLWMVALPALLGAGVWFWFDFGRLSGDLDLVMRPLPAFAGGGLVWWLGLVALPVAGFALTWNVLRSKQVGLDAELALARRRAEHKALLEASETLWAAVEAAEQAGDAAGQLAAVDAWAEHARRVELTADLTADRVKRLREMARTVGATEPDAAVRLLEEAKALSEVGADAPVGRWPVMKAEMGRFAAGFFGAMLGIPLLVAPGAIVVWMLNMLLAIVIVIAIIAVVLAVFAG